MWHEHKCVKNKKLPGVKRLEENRPRYQLWLSLDSGAIEKSVLMPRLSLMSMYF